MKMNKLMSMCAVVLMAALTVSATTGVAYGDYLELATTPQQLGSGQWEYVYDLYSTGDLVSGVILPGVDVTKADSASLHQRWDCNAAGFATALVTMFGQGVPQADYPSVGDGVSTWTLNSANSYALTNSWHDPSDYVAYHYYSKGVQTGCDYDFLAANRTSLSDPTLTYSGPGLLWFAPLVMLGSDSENTVCSDTNPGLVATFRLVSDDAPGVIDYELYVDAENLDMAGTIQGPAVPEPATMSLLVIGSVALLKRKRK